MLFSQNKVEDAKDNREGDHLYPRRRVGRSPASKEKASFQHLDVTC